MTKAIETTKKEITETLKENENKYGKCKGYTIIQEAYHGCYPDRENTWEALAAKIEGGELIIVWVQWDFTSYIEENGDTDDASNYPFDDDDIVTIKENEIFDIKDSNYEGWI